MGNASSAPLALAAVFLAWAAFAEPPTPAFAQTSSDCSEYNSGEICKTVETCTWFDYRSAQCGQWTTVYYRLPASGSGGGGGSPLCPDAPAGECPVPAIESVITPDSQ